ncbi:hypothetical protein, conserved [Plasmodium vivax]|uniref:VIR protein n=1 Tax=Plasmodium vivax TaxID=5855 RepID=A0A1G4HDU3_PLAVI|nr:hypothetical protein, conserved [Plasmodium vivax]
MPGGTLDIAELKNEYPFLKEIWKLYKIDVDPKETDNSNQLFSICNEYSMYKSNPTDNLKNACRKLLKKFELLHANEISTSEHNEWCNNINNWIYHEINPRILNDDIINHILIKAQENFFSHMPNKRFCSYTTLNKTHKPEDLNKLRIFNDNTSTFKTILLDKSLDYYCSCRNFVNDCVNIYKTLQSKHCNTTINKDNRVTCEIVNNFNIYYGGYLYNTIGTQEKLPDLSSTTDININIEDCKSQTNVKGLDSTRGDESSASAVSTTQAETAGKTVPTAIGTIAGVSSVLALLYKFSPARTWMHSGLRGNGKMIHTNLYAGGERELLTDGPLIENLNSYNIGYEVA